MRKVNVKLGRMDKKGVRKGGEGGRRRMEVYGMRGMGRNWERSYSNTD